MYAFLALHATFQFCLQVANTWECIVSIFKGLKELDYELISSYKEVIIIGRTHPNPSIKALTRCIFEIETNNCDSTGQCMLEELRKIIETSFSTKSDTKKKTETEKEVRIAGSFLNRKSATTKPVSGKSSKKNDKNTPILPEPDSQVNNVYYFMFTFLYIFLHLFDRCSLHFQIYYRIMCT